MMSRYLCILEARVFAGNYQRAFETYKEIHKKFPENIDCSSGFSYSVIRC